MATRVPETFYQTYRPHLLRRVARELRSARRVADLGCGDCQLASLLSGSGGHEVIGVDVRAGDFPRKPDRKGRRRCVKADAGHLDFVPTGTVDAVVSVSALHEFAAPMAVLREARRILRPGGEILIVDFPRGSLAQKLWHEHYYTTGEVCRMLARAGFVRVQCRRIAHKQLTWARGFAGTSRKRGRRRAAPRVEGQPARATGSHGSRRVSAIRARAFLWSLPRRPAQQPGRRQRADRAPRGSAHRGKP